MDDHNSFSPLVYYDIGVSNHGGGRAMVYDPEPVEAYQGDLDLDEEGMIQGLVEEKTEENDTQGKNQAEASLEEHIQE
ncbi:hypothetical protein ACP4OV_021207 [Aristida adscensionis]